MGSELRRKTLHYVSDRFEDFDVEVLTPLQYRRLHSHDSTTQARCRGATPIHYATHGAYSSLPIFTPRTNERTGNARKQRHQETKVLLHRLTMSTFTAQNQPSATAITKSALPYDSTGRFLHVGADRAPFAVCATLVCWTWCSLSHCRLVWSRPALVGCSTRYRVAAPRPTIGDRTAESTRPSCPFQFAFRHPPNHLSTLASDFVTNRPLGCSAANMSSDFELHNDRHDHVSTLLLRLQDSPLHHLSTATLRHSC